MLFLGQADAYVILNPKDSVSQRFVTQTLRPLLQRKGRTCLTSGDFVSGVTHDENVTRAIKFTNIVIVVVTALLARGKRVERDISTAVSDDIKHNSERVVPILLGKGQDPPPQLTSICSISYDPTHPGREAEQRLEDELEKAFRFQDARKRDLVTSSRDLLCRKRAEAEKDRVTSASATNLQQEIIRPPQHFNREMELETCDSEGDETQFEHTTTPQAHQTTRSPKEPQVASADSTKTYELHIFEPFRSGLYYHARRRAYTMYCISILVSSLLFVTSFILSLIPNEGTDKPAVCTPQKLVTHGLLLLFAVVPARQFSLYLNNAARPDPRETVILGEGRLRRIANHMMGESQMEHQVESPDEMFVKLCLFLQSVATVNLVTAWLYSVTLSALLWQLGYFIQGSNTEGDYCWVVLQFVVLTLAQGFLRTLIGIYHYERNLLVDTHKIVADGEPEECCAQIRKAARMLNERISVPIKRALIFGTLLAVVVILVTGYDIGSAATTSNKSEARDSYTESCLIIWLLVVEALINCPTRHMKITAVALNALAVVGLWLLEVKLGVNHNLLFGNSLPHFLSLLDLRILCLVSPFFLMLYTLTVLRTKNWPLTTVELRQNWPWGKQTALIVTSTILLWLGIFQPG